MRTVVAVVALVACVHAGLWTLFQRQEAGSKIDGPLASLSYNPFGRAQDPTEGDRATAEQIRSDLRLLSPYTRAIRTYQSTQGVELVPSIAAEFGLKVTVGIWLGNENTINKDGSVNKDAARNKEKNQREIKQAIALAKRNRNVNAIVVGNETLLRGDKTVDELIQIIQDVKRDSPVPVTTGETHDRWLARSDSKDLGSDDQKALAELGDKIPKLAAAVDYIAVHILPYWDKEPADRAVDKTIERYEEMRRAFPGKRIVIAEFGWPSAGYNFHTAMPGRVEQAKIIRDFITSANARGIDYNIIEAIDQPWKTSEGSVGAYWGLFDASRQAKFVWSGPIIDSEHDRIAGIAVLLGLLLSLTAFAKPRATTGEIAVFAVATNAIGAWFAVVFAFWNTHYFVWGAAFALGIGILLLIPLVLIALARIEEIAAILFGRPPQRLIGPETPRAEGFHPKVSIHIPAYREPPEMLKQTLDAVARLDYPNFECVVIINNTPDPAFWLPVESHCRELGERFKFINEDNVPGFKAGALRLALAQTAADAEIIGIIDADYVVQPGWLKDLAPLFADQKVGMIQAPQDHRDGERSLMHESMNGEYAGFFDIGMVQRNEANAIIVHGTMCLIRRTALESAGGWSSDTIVEDTDLGLSILERGWQVHYTNRRYGHGLLPDTFDAFKKQRHRWAYGGFQIIRKHWHHLLPGSRTLTRDQKREFGFGWLNWLGAETIGVVVMMLNLVWVPVVAFVGIAIPDKILTIPILAAFVISFAHFIMLYRRRVAITPRQMVGAVITAMSVQWTVARAVGFGIWKEGLPFMRTAKGGHTRKGADFPAFWEAVIAALLLIGAVLVVMTNYTQVHEVNIFALVLVVQSLPFVAAGFLAAVEGTRFNEFAFWQGIASRFATVVSRPAPAAQAPVQVPGEKRVETV
jgi:cellulose synthase/poly-beta-1,6-N-acetylglucosamine synthase-like glycosyltransferase/exo-beta-1,3-glucanase (GH17 family)